jgi:hypothetical protein
VLPQKLGKGPIEGGREDLARSPNLRQITNPQAPPEEGPAVLESAGVLLQEVIVALRGSGPVDLTQQLDILGAETPRHPDSHQKYREQGSPEHPVHEYPLRAEAFRQEEPPDGPEGSTDTSHKHIIGREFLRGWEPVHVTRLPP